MAELLPHALLGDTAVGQQQLLAAWIIATTLNLVLFYVMLVFVRRVQPGPRRLHRVDASAPKAGTGCTAEVEWELKATDWIWLAGSEGEVFITYWATLLFQFLVFSQHKTFLFYSILDFLFVSKVIFQ